MKLTVKQENAMDEEYKRQFLTLVKGKDISEIMSLLAESGNQYSRRILRFFRWFCKWVPIMIMVAHMYGMFDFSRNQKEMFAVHGLTGRAIRLFTSWSMCCLWLLFLRHASFGYAGSTAYHSSTSLPSTPYILYIGVGTQRKR